MKTQIEMKQPINVRQKLFDMEALTEQRIRDIMANQKIGYMICGEPSVGFSLSGLIGSMFAPFCVLRQLLKRINYVHELQHALKLCGIEKEIEL